MQLKAIKTRKVFLLFGFVLMAFFVAFQPVRAVDCTNQTGFQCAYSGLTEAAGNNFNQDVNAQSLIGSIVSAALSLLGIVFVLLMLYGGYLWMTARGDERQVTKAQDLIQAAIIGLVIVMGAYAISYFVVSRLQGATLSA